jgi:hypothetical protein
MSDFGAIGFAAAIGGAAFFGVREALAARKRQLHWRRELDEALRDPKVRGAITSNLDLEIANREVARESGNGWRRMGAGTDLAMLHLFVARLLVEDGAFADAARHLDDVAPNYFHGEFARLRSDVAAAIAAAGERRDGRAPLR